MGMFRQLGNPSVRLTPVGRAIGGKGNPDVLPEVIESRLAPVHEQPHHPVVAVFSKDDGTENIDGLFSGWYIDLEPARQVNHHAVL